MAGHNVRIPSRELCAVFDEAVLHRIEVSAGDTPMKEAMQRSPEVTSKDLCKFLSASSRNLRTGQMMRRKEPVRTFCLEAPASALGVLGDLRHRVWQRRLEGFFCIRERTAFRAWLWKHGPRELRKERLFANGWKKRSNGQAPWPRESVEPAR